MESVNRTIAKPDTSPGTAWVWVSVVLAAFVGLMLTLGSPLLFRHGLKTGHISEREIVAVRPVTVVDESATRQAQESAAASVVPVFKRDHSRDGLILGRLESELNQVEALQKDVGL